MPGRVFSAFAAAVTVFSGSSSVLLKSNALVKTFVWVTQNALRFYEGLLSFAEKTLQY